MKTIETIKKELGVDSLQGVDLQGVDLRWADLQGANLEGADLRWANLGGADLRWADLWNVTGNNLEIITLQTKTYTINYTKDVIQIGCKNYSHKKWEEFRDYVIAGFDYDALEWWKGHKEWLFKAIELNPAK